MRIKLLALMLFVAGAAFAQLSIGVRIGAPPPVRIMRAQPRSPGPDYMWIGGYWYPNGGHYRWHKRILDSSGLRRSSLGRASS